MSPVPQLWVYDDAIGLNQREVTVMPSPSFPMLLLAKSKALVNIVRGHGT